MRDRQGEVEPDVAVDVGEPARLAHERVAVEEHERRLAEALDQRLEVARVHRREEEVGVAEARMHLDRQGPAGLLVRLERGKQHLSDAASFDSVGAGRRPQTLEIEPAAIGGDRLQSDEASLARGRDLRAHVLERVVELLLGDALDAHDRQRTTAGQHAELLPVHALVRRREAVVDEQDLHPGRTQERRRVVGRVGEETALEHRLLGRLAAEERAELAQHATVGQPGGEMRPLPWVVALRMQPAELVQRRAPAQDAVRVVVDEANLAQYLEK